MLYSQQLEWLGCCLPEARSSRMLQLILGGVRVHIEVLHIRIKVHIPVAPLLDFPELVSRWLLLTQWIVSTDYDLPNFSTIPFRGWQMKSRHQPRDLRWYFEFISVSYLNFNVLAALVSTKYINWRCFTISSYWIMSFCKDCFTGNP